MNYTFQFSEVWASREDLLWGAWHTVQLTAAAMVFGMALALVCAFVRMVGPRPLQRVVIVYVEAIRNTPLLVQVFLVFFGLPSAGIRLSPDQAALIALTLNVGAYVTEIVRAGLEAIPAGQVEAGLALGLKRWKVFLKVELFQAIAAVFPALASQFILMLLASSLLSAVAATELTGVANDIQARTFRSFEVYLAVTLIYFVLAMGFTGLFALLEKTVLQRHLQARRMR